MPDETPALLRQHWETWTRFEDFQKIASAGFNVVRIPVGYWAYDNSSSPYFKGADEYLQKAVEWARTTVPPLKVIIDLHGAPGSQNGYDNSGQRTETPMWLTDGGVHAPTAYQTLCVIDTIAGIYMTSAYEKVVIGIELINEPQGWRLDRQVLTDFFREGFGKIRHHSENTVVVLSDAFDWTSSWNGVLTPQDGDAHNVAIGEIFFISDRIGGTDIFRSSSLSRLLTSPGCSFTRTTDRGRLFGPCLLLECGQMDLRWRMDWRLD
jgi:aryl-phospho-beta-D-glucosidase BglC (GH1 family)